jgi:hypothetical protein
MNAMRPFSAKVSLARQQRDFAGAILFDDKPIPAIISAASGRASTSRFGVYRNNVIAGLINAVAARYPVVRKLLSSESFDEIARMFVMTEPPRSPVLLDYGDGFPQFLRSIGRIAAADYVADIAELESARTRAYHAADATPLSRNAFTEFAADKLPDMRLMLHPSVSLLKSRFPIVTIWETNRHTGGNSLSQWKPEAALIARPYLDVTVWRLSRSAYEFLAAIAEGQTIGLAIARASAGLTDFNLGECIHILIAAEIVVGIEQYAVLSTDGHAEMTELPTIAAGH